MRLPYLLIDIDGVLIPFPEADGATPSSHVRHDVVPSGRPSDAPVPVWLNPAHGSMLTDLVRTRLVAPMWCTSWRRNAITLIGPLLSLPAFPYVDLPRPDITTSHPDGYLWKRDHVDILLGDAPAAWIDDDFTELDHAWATERAARGLPTLLVQPDPYVGLLPEHLVTVRNWAAALHPPAASPTSLVRVSTFGTSPSSQNNAAHGSRGTGRPSMMSWATVATLRWWERA